MRSPYGGADATTGVVGGLPLPPGRGGGPTHPPRQRLRVLIILAVDSFILVVHGFILAVDSFILAEDGFILAEYGFILVVDSLY